MNLLMSRFRRVFFILLLAHAPVAYAYIDPGSQILLLQGFLAIIGALIALIRHPIDTVKTLIKRFRRRGGA